MSSHAYRRVILAALAVVALAAGAARAQPALVPVPYRPDRFESRPLSPGDLAFVVGAATASAAEIDFARLAMERSGDPAVRGYAGRMLAENARMSDELAVLLARQGLAIAPAAGAAERDDRRWLAGLSGADFDRGYATLVVHEHGDDLAAFRRERERGSNIRVRSFAARNWWVIRDHLRLARRQLAPVGAGRVF
jgi:putative membrane protein